MTAPTPAPIVPAEHLIVIAVRDPWIAHRCREILTNEGYPIVLPQEITGAGVIETITAHRPHLLIIDDEVEWAEGIHVAQRLHADPVFANLYVLAILRLSTGIPDWMRGDWSRNSQITKPFNPAELVFFVRRIFELVIAGEAPPFLDPNVASTLTEADWQDWKRGLPPYALFDAAWKGDQARVERLIAEGVNVQAKDIRGSTALHSAARKGNLHLARLLLQHGAEVDAQNNLGETPLWQAVEYGHLIVGHLLLKRGADPNTANAQGETALQRARQQNRREIERLLREHGAQQ